MGPSHGLQLFMSCSSMDPFHRIQTVRKIAPAWSPRGSQVSPANLLQCGLLSSQSNRSHQEPAPPQASHGVTTSFGNPPAPAWGPPWSVGEYLLQHGPPWAAGAELPLHNQSATQAAGQSLLSTSSTSCSSFYADLGV